MAVTLLTSISDLACLTPEWDDLAENAIERNVYYESWFLLPALRHLPNLDVSVLTVRDAGNELIGLFPLSHRHSYRLLAVNHLGLWQHLHCFLCTPLVRRGREEQCLEQFFQWLRRRRGNGCIFEFQQLTGDGPFFEHLERYLRRKRIRMDETNSYFRPFVRCNVDSQSYFNSVLPGKQRKKLKTKIRHLAEAGNVRVETLETEGNVDWWLDRFFQLEASGWKGRGGTALANNPEERAFCETALRTAFVRGQLLLLMLRVNEVPVAMNCLLRSGLNFYSFKIAYDEEYARYSPGLLLMLHTTTHLLDNHPSAVLDSCAAPQHSMLIRLWKEERQIRTLVVSTDPFLGNALLGTVRLARNTRRVFAEHVQPAAARVITCMLSKRHKEALAGWLKLKLEGAGREAAAVLPAYTELDDVPEQDLSRV